MRWIWLWALAAVVAAGCSSSNEAPTPIPIPLAPATQIDNFSGTLKVQGSNYHQFQLKQAGEVDITLTTTAYAPVTDPTTGVTAPSTRTDPIPPLTLLIGTPAATVLGLQCSALSFDSVPLITTATASSTAQLKGNALVGNFCISLSDPTATLLDPITYKISVARPADP
jgi:hypothetical protein